MTLDELFKNQPFIGLGIAGNQAEHLDQAGEADDFKDVVALENAPKGIFLWYLPGAETFLQVNPLSHHVLRLGGNERLQPEPEIALAVQFSYATDGKVSGLQVLGFTAFNDCSRRVNEPKISLKKNWGESSQGIAERVVRLDDFTTVGGTIEQYRLMSFLKREGELLEYGKDTAISDYCYLNETLVDWIVNQLNSQQDEGPLEALLEMISQSYSDLQNRPEYGVIGIGATCYSDFGNSEERFLREGDEVIVMAYDATKTSLAQVRELAAKAECVEENEAILMSRQKVVT